MHKHGSQAAQRHNIGFINQRDMVLTLYSFSAFSIVRPEFFGLPNDPEMDRAMFHFWHVIGYMLGIEDQFNIFNGDVETVHLRSQAVCTHIFTPAFLHPPAKFELMYHAAVDGMRAMAPEANLETMRFLLQMLNRIPGYYLTAEDKSQQLRYLEDHSHYVGDTERLKALKEDLASNPTVCSKFKALPWTQRFNIRLTIYAVGPTSSDILRKLANKWGIFRWKLLIRFPIIAMIRFGRNQAYVEQSIRNRFLKGRV